MYVEIDDLPRNTERSRYQFACRCTDGPHGPGGVAIHEMTDAARPITYATFVRHVSVAQLRRIPEFSTYAWGNERGLKMKDDRLLQKSYFRSKWRGVSCVYVQWSRIEFIFTLDGQEPEYDPFYDGRGNREF